MVEWKEKPCIVVASGPSLTKERAHAVRMSRWLNDANVLVVNDAYRPLIHADALYAADFAWWKERNGVPEFTGEKWTSTSTSLNFVDDKSKVAKDFNFNLVNAKDGAGFCEDGKSIHYGGPNAHSGFQAINLAIRFGAKRICLVGFDYGYSGSSHFFGNHTRLRNPSDHEYQQMAKAFDSVMTKVEIVNANPLSNLKKFPFVDLNEELRRYSRLHWYGPESLARAS